MLDLSWLTRSVNQITKHQNMCQRLSCALSMCGRLSINRGIHFVSRNICWKKQLDGLNLEFQKILEKYSCMITSKDCQRLSCALTRRSNRNFNIPRANFGHLTIFYARKRGNLTGKAFLRMGNLTFAWVVGGKIEPLLSGFKRLVAREGHAVSWLVLRTRNFDLRKTWNLDILPLQTRNFAFRKISRYETQNY